MESFGQGIEDEVSLCRGDDQKTDQMRAEDEAFDMAPSPIEVLLSNEHLDEVDDEEFVQYWKEIYSGVSGKNINFEMPEHFFNRLVSIAREKILAEFPETDNEKSKYNIAKEFLEVEGFSMAPFAVLDKEDFSKVRQICRDITGFFDPENMCRGNEGAASYDSLLKMIFVFRNEEMDELNGEKCTPSRLVHEGIHATSQYEFKNLSPKDGHKVVSAARTGFSFPARDYGHLLEEGMADKYRAEFIARNLTEEENQMRAKSFDVGRLEANDMITYRIDSRVLPVPAKYYSIYPGGLGTPFNALAGLAVELLCEERPELKKWMIEARSSAKGIREVHRILDEISPGLYLELQKTDYKEEEFFDKLALVIGKTKGSVEKLVTEGNQKNGELMESWKKTLDNVENGLRIDISLAAAFWDAYEKFGNDQNFERATEHILKAGEIIKYPYEFAEKYKEEYRKTKEKIDFYQVRRPMRDKDHNRENK